MGRIKNEMSKWKFNLGGNYLFKFVHIKTQYSAQQNGTKGGTKTLWDGPSDCNGTVDVKISLQTQIERTKELSQP